MGLLQRLGFDISEEEVTAPAPATCQILKERGLRPHLLIHEGRPAWDFFGGGQGEGSTLTGPNHEKHMQVFHDTCESSGYRTHEASC